MPKQQVAASVGVQSARRFTATAAATAAAPLLRLALDGTTLYWIDTAKIAKVPVAGGATLQVIDFDVPGTDATSTMAIDINNVYWTEPQSKQIRGVVRYSR